MRLRLLAAVLPVLLLATACGSDDPVRTAEDPPSSEEPSEEPSGEPSESLPEPTSVGTSGTVSELPDCATVWVAGQDLPRPYRGCVEDGAEVRPDSVFCSFGRPLVTHADRFWALPGAEVHGTAGPLEQDRGYRRALRSCTA